MILKKKKISAVLTGVLKVLLSKENLSGTKTICQKCKSKQLNFLKTTESYICSSIPAPLFSRMSFNCVFTAAKVSHDCLFFTTFPPRSLICSYRGNPDEGNLVLGRQQRDGDADERREVHGQRAVSEPVSASQVGQLSEERGQVRSRSHLL